MRLFALLTLAILAVPIGCTHSGVILSRGTPAEQRGREAIERHGCGSCHSIPGIHEAQGLVGPSLERVASRTYLAGVLTISPDHMRR